MKKSVSILIILCMALTACGSKEQTVTYRSETEEDGVKIVDTMTLDAVDDRVQTMAETIEVDMSSLDAETQEMLYVIYDELAAAYQSVEGVECTGEAGEGIYTISIVIDAAGGAVTRLAKQGLLEVEGDSSGISLKKTSESLESRGYVLAE